VNAIINLLLRLIPFPAGTLTYATGLSMVAYGAGGGVWHVLSKGENGLDPDMAVKTTLAGLALIGVRRALPDKG